MDTPEQFVDELGVTAVNAAQIEETLLHQVRCPRCEAFSMFCFWLTVQLRQAAFWQC